MNSNILVVDDSAFSRRTARRLLEEIGHQVQEAATGPEALERCYLQPPDLVLLDLVLDGGMYGIEVLAKLRQMRPDIKVIAVSADIQQATEAQVRASGGMGFIQKPLNRDKLAAALKVALEPEQLCN